MQFDRLGITQCPSWQKQASIGTPTAQRIDSLAVEFTRLPARKTETALPVKSDFREDNLYAVAFEAPAPSQGCATAGECATACAAGFNGFVLRDTRTNRAHRSRVLATRHDVCHRRRRPLSQTRVLSSDVVLQYAVRERQSRPALPRLPAQTCSYYAGSIHIKLPLQLDCLESGRFHHLRWCLRAVTPRTVGQRPPRQSLRIDQSGLTSLIGSDPSCSWTPMVTVCSARDTRPWRNPRACRRQRSRPRCGSSAGAGVVFGGLDWARKEPAAQSDVDAVVFAVDNEDARQVPVESSAQRHFGPANHFDGHVPVPKRRPCLRTTALVGETRTVTGTVFSVPKSSDLVDSTAPGGWPVVTGAAVASAVAGGLIAVGGAAGAGVGFTIVAAGGRSDNRDGLRTDRAGDNRRHTHQRDNRGGGGEQYSPRRHSKRAARKRGRQIEVPGRQRVRHPLLSILKQPTEG